MEIATKAGAKGICPEWFDKMTIQTDIGPLCKMFFDGSDWAMEQDFPGIDTLRKFIGKAERHGLFPDFKGVVGFNDGLNQAAFFGDSDAEIDATNFSVGEIYVRHNSKVKLRVKNSAHVVLNVLDAAVVDIECAEDASVSVYVYGSPTVNVVAGQNVKVTKKSFQ